jgi:hypothetical protein
VHSIGTAVVGLTLGDSVLRKTQRQRRRETASRSAELSLQCFDSGFWRFRMSEEELRRDLDASMEFELAG